jgi:putative OPT family oligopeptide transporter
MPMKWVIILIVAAVVPLFLVYQHFVGDMMISLPMAALMVVLGFLFSAVAGYMAGVVGSSNNPVSGVTIATVVVCSLLILLLMGKENESAPAFAIIIGSVVCCAAAIAGDNMQDLKAGHILKATPWKQQVMQMVGTISAALVMAPVLGVLLKAYGFQNHSSATTNALAAPQAQLISSVAEGVFEGNLPWNYVYVGMVLAALIIFADSRLKAAKSTFRLPVLAVAIGIYLPLELSVPIFAGGLISLAIKAASKAKEEVLAGNGLLFASGLITGEALVGISMAVVIVIAGKGDVLQIADSPLGAWPGLILLGGLGYWLYSIGRKDQK